MPKSATNIGIKVKIDIRPGPATPLQKAAWRKFFTRLKAECQREFNTESDKNGKPNVV
jgi:hypothetical protein